MNRRAVFAQQMLARLDQLDKGVITPPVQSQPPAPTAAPPSRSKHKTASDIERRMRAALEELRKQD